MSNCTFEGCERPQKSRELCNTHYMQFYKTGTTWPIGTKVRPKASEQPCTFEGCGQPQFCRGLCVGHDGQMRRTGELWPLHERRARPPRPKKVNLCTFEGCERPVHGQGLCTTHHRQQSETGETWKIGSRRGHMRFRDETEAERRLRYAHYGRAHRYGMTTTEFRAFVEACGNKCGICGKPGDPDERGGGLVVDHDHSCCHITSPAERKALGRGNYGPLRTCGKCTRGLLCVACNAGIGQFGEDRERLQSAIAYLERWVESR